MFHDPLKLTAGPKVCIRTCDRPVLLNRLLRSIAEWEPWMLDLEIEVSDGSHSSVGKMATADVCAERGVTYVDACEFPHAAFYWQTYRGCRRGGGYNMWQIMERHRGREIILLDDDWVFPLSKSVGGPAKIGSMVADRYIFSSDLAMPDSVNNLPAIIQEAKDAGCNTVQVCTTGHGVCNDYSWVPEMQLLGLVGGDPESSEFVRYKLNHPRILLSGFMTPIWIGCVPHVKPIPPNSADDDTIMLQHNDLGMCLWSDAAITHLRDKPKDFTRRIVTDYEIIHMAMQLFQEHQEVRPQSVERCTQLIADAKRAYPDYFRADELCTYINLFLKSPNPPQFGAQ